MRGWITFLSLSLTLLAQRAARGGFDITASLDQSGANDVWTFQARNDGQNTGTTLLDMDVTLQAFTSRPGLPLPAPDGHLYVRAFDADGNGMRDDLDVANLAGPSGVPDRTYVRAGPINAWSFVYANPPWRSPDDAVQQNFRNTTPWSDTTLTQLNGVGSTTLDNHGILDTQPQTFAVALVPRGQWVRLSGFLGGDQGPAFTIPPTIVPEPSLFAIAAGPLLAALLRRRTSPVRA